ncbi:MAG: methyltransferase domain-containing protein [Acidobacteriota bacterium]
MRQRLLDLLVCPRCQGELSCRATTTTSDQDVLDGELACSGCGRAFPVVRGIPRFVPTENYAASFGYQWSRFRQEQIDSLNGTRLSEHRFRTETEWAPEWMAGKVVLEAGCGAGRFLEIASRETTCDVVGIDLSHAVDAAHETLAGRRNVHLVQASIFELPFRPGSVDGVYCIGVIQHTPDPEGAIGELAKVLKSSGRIALTIYERRPTTWLHGKYWLRPLTRRLRPQVLLGLIRFAMPLGFVLSEVLFRVPVLGRFFTFVVPVANYVDNPELSWRQRYRWAILDTFDMFAPAYDRPQREEDVAGTLADAGIDDIRRLPNAGLNLVGTKTGPGQDGRLPTHARSGGRYVH